MAETFETVGGQVSPGIDDEAPAISLPASPSIAAAFGSPTDPGEVGRYEAATAEHAKLIERERVVLARFFEIVEKGYLAKGYTTEQVARHAPALMKRAADVVAAEEYEQTRQRPTS